MVSFDDGLKLIGEFGKYQKFIYFFCFHIVSLVGVFSNLPIVFLVATPDHWCASPGLKDLNLTRETQLNLTIPTVVKDGKTEYSHCRQYDRDYTNWTQYDVTETITKGLGNVSTVECKSGWEYDHSIYHSTIVSEWNLVCDMKMWVATSKSVYLGGFIVGVLLFGFISDTFGRRKSYIATVILKLIISILIPLSPNLIAFLVYRFLSGAISIGNFTIMYILMLELVGPSWRGFVAIVLGYIAIAEGCLFTGVAYLVRDWRYLAIVIASPTVLQLVNLFFVYESPRWLYTQERNEEADLIMRKIAKTNGKEFPEKIKIEIKEREKGKFTDLVRYPKLRLRMIILCIQWVVVTMVYYGLAYGTSEFGGNPYINFCLGYAVEIPSNILCHVLMRFTGRKKILMAFDVIGGAALLGILAVPSSYSGAYAITLTLSLIGRLASVGVFIMVYLYTAELLPTVVRSVGMGTASATARIGGISAQYLMGLKDVSKFIPYVTMGGLSIMAALLLWPLPETRGKKLPETILEGENFGRKDVGEKGVDSTTENYREIESTYM